MGSQVFQRRSSIEMGIEGNGRVSANLLLEFIGLLLGGVGSVGGSVGGLVLKVFRLSLDIITRGLLELLLSSSDVAVKKVSDEFLLRFLVDESHLVRLTIQRFGERKRRGHELEQRIRQACPCWQTPERLQRHP